MKVLEIFESIQGEGYWTGLYVTFVRTAGCNLSCPWCDTKSSWSVSKAKDMTPEEIASKVHTSHVVLTGGEPTIQKDFEEVCKALSLAGHLVHIETNGTRAVTTPYADWITMSPKPQSNFEYHDCNELKIIVTPDMTLDFIKDLISINPPAYIYLNPEATNMKENVQKCFEFIKELNDVRFRLGVQLHKLIGVA